MKERKVIISIIMLLLVVVIVGVVLYNHMQEEITVDNKPEVNEKIENEIQEAELTENYMAEGLQLSIKYHSDWSIVEESSIYLKFNNKGDESPFIGIFVSDFDKTREIKDYLYAYNDMIFTTEEEGEIIIAGLNGYYHKIHVVADNNKMYEAGIVKDGRLYKFMYYTIEEDYEKYEEVFEEMLETVVFTEN